MARTGAARVKLDVRWDAGDVEAARAVAAATGRKLADVMRAAVAVGLRSRGLAEALRAESTAGRGGVARAGVIDHERLSSEAVGMMRGARSPAAAGGVVQAGAAVAPRPAAASGARSVPSVKLVVVVARRRAGEAGRTAVPADVIDARRLVSGGRVLVGGQVEKDPNRIVDPGRVEIQ